MDSFKVKIPKSVDILGHKFKIIKNPKTNGGFFNIGLDGNEITIGTLGMEDNPDWTFNVLMHEISEAIHCLLNYRYEAYGDIKDYKFVMNHKEFENHNLILSGILYNQILK